MLEQNHYKVILTLLIVCDFCASISNEKSIQLGITPDNPSPDGAISRVVKGVTIHEYQK